MFNPKLIDQVLIFLLVLFGVISMSAQQVLDIDQKQQIRYLSSELIEFDQHDIYYKIPIFKLEEKSKLKSLKARQNLGDYNLLSVDIENMSRLLSMESPSIKLDIPIGLETKTLDLQLVDFLTSDFKVRKASNPSQAIEVDLGLTYRGVVEGVENSLVTISFFGKEVAGMIVADGATYNLGKLENASNHIIYEEKDLKHNQKFTCHTDDNLNFGDKNVHSKQEKSNAADNCVTVYVETEFDMYQERGSVASVTSFVTSLFAQVSTIYANEDINLLLSEVFVWDINDPYVGNSPSTLLNEFMNRLDGNFNGDIAHLINFEQNGGIAYVDALCSPFPYGTSGIDNSFSTVPNYSWSVNILAHEIGHNLGSPHTHACAWNGNNTPIDGCGNDGDGCNKGPLPSAGTIMSYCHQVNGVGIDLSLGFGPQPGDLIREAVACSLR